MAIQNGQLADASEVLSVILKPAILSIPISQKLYDKKDTSTAENDSLMQNNMSLDNFEWESFVQGLTNEDTTNSTAIADNEIENSSGTSWEVLRNAFNCLVLDSFDDASVDSDIWSTTGTVTEASGYLALADAATCISDGTSGFDAYALAGDSELIFCTHFGDGSISWSCKIQISDGTNHVDIFTREIGGSGNPPYNYRDTVRIKIDKSAEEAFYKIGNNAWSSAIDISSAGSGGDGNWYIRFTQGSADTCRIYFVGYVDGSAGTVDWVTSDKTFLSTKTDGILTWEYDGTDSDIAGYLSADGTNYSACTKDTWTSITNTGTTGKIKLTMTVPTSITGDGATVNIKGVKAIGAYFNE